MRSLAILALWALPAAAAAPGTGIPLQALTEADVGADALENAACYAHDGPAVLVLATRKNAVVNAEGDLLLLDRLDGGGFPGEGARYGSNSFKVVISPAPGELPAAGIGPTATNPTERSAQISVRRRGSSSSITARWSCNPARGT